MPEALELQGVATGIEEEHRGLLTRLSRVADTGLQNELDARGADPVRYALKNVPGEQRPEVRHRHGNALDAAGVLGRRGFAGIVSGDLVTEEVEVHPAFRTAAFPAAQYL